MSNNPIDIIVRIEDPGNSKGFQYNRGDRTIHTSRHYPRQEASHLFDDIPF